MIAHLYEFIFTNEEKPATAPITPLRPPAQAVHHSESPDYLEAHVCEALKEDGRTSHHDLRVLLSGRQLVVEGQAPSEVSRRAVSEVAERAAPGYDVANRVQVAAMAGPERAEEIS